MIEVVDHRIVVNPFIVKEAGLEDKLPQSNTGSSYILTPAQFEGYKEELEIAEPVVANQAEELGFSDSDDEKPNYWSFIYQIVFQEAAQDDAELLAALSGGETLSRCTITVNSSMYFEKFPEGKEIEGVEIVQTEEQWSDGNGNSGPETMIQKTTPSNGAVSTESQGESPTADAQENEQPASPQPA